MPRYGGKSGICLNCGFISVKPDFPAGGVEKCKIPPDAMRTTQKLITNLQNKPNSAVLQQLFSQLCFQILGEARFGAMAEISPETKPAVNGGEQQLLRRLEAMMCANISKPLSLKMLSELTLISPSGINRIFAKYHQQSPAAFYRNLRLEKARELLESGRYSVIAAAGLTGFSSPQHLSAAFRMRYNLTPSECAGLS